MKRVPVILRVIIFIAAFLLFSHWVTRAYVDFTRQPFEYEGTRRGFEAVMDETSFLVLGDSHPQNSVYTPGIPGAYNFSSSGESYVLTYSKMRHYLKSENLDLDVVVMPISLHTFAGYRIKRIGKQDPAFWAQFVDFIQLGRETGQMEYFLTSRLKAEFAYLGGLDDIFAVANHESSWTSDRLDQGYISYTEKFSDWEEDSQVEQGIKRAAFHFEEVAYIDPLVVTYFNRLLDLLEEEGVKMVFISYPSTQFYREAAAEYFPVADHISRMEALLEGREDVLILDYHALLPDRNDLFTNADHLNTDGARIFTQILLADLEENGITWELPPQP